MKHIYSIINLLVLFTISNSIWGQVNITDGGYSPDQSETDVSTSSNLVLTFDQNIQFNTSSTRYYIEIYEVGVTPPLIDFQIRYGAADDGVSINNNVLTIDSPIDFNDNTTYYVLIEADAIESSVGGGSFAGIIDVNQWRFTTAALSPNPTIVSYDPTEDATNISPDQILELTFDRNIQFNPSSTRYYIEIYEDGVGTPFYESQIRYGSADNGTSISNNILTIDSPISFNSSTTYYILIDSDGLQAAADGANFAGISDVNQWRFTTSAPLAISEYNPIQNYIDILINQNPQLTFNQDIEFINPPAFSDAVYLKEQGTGRIIQTYAFTPGTANPNLTINGTTFTINLTQNMDASTATYITIPSGFIQSTAGEEFGGINNAEDNNWRFTTIGGPSWATDYPSTNVIDFNSAQLLGQTDMSGTYIYVITATSDIPTVDQIKGGTVPGTILTNQGSPGTMSAGVEFIDLIDISDSETYTPNTTYYVYMVATDGTFFLDSEIGETTFTTLETDAPIASTSPADGDASVSIFTNVIITYDEPVRKVDGTEIDNSNVAELITKFQRNPANPVAFTATIDATKQIITITPDAALDDNASFDVAIFMVEDNLGNQQTDPTEITFTTGNYVIWSGETSSDWEVNQNWDGNFTAGANVQIPASATNMPIISTSTSVENIAIEAGADLTIASGGVLSVSGTFDLQSSNVSSIGNASFLNEGTLNVVGSNVNIDQNITSSPAKWYFLSSPVGNATQTNINCTGTVYEYDIATDTWPAHGASTPMADAVGYKVYSTQNMTFSGDINNAALYSFNASRTSVNAGWNLAGNPYPCTIDWNALDKGDSGLFDGFWVWLNDTQQYGTYNGDAGVGSNMIDLAPESHIPSNHSFWVKVPIGETGGTLNIPASSRSHNSFTYLKSTQPNNQGIIRLLAKNGDQKDEAVIAFNDAADNYIDSHDSQKRFASRYAKYFEIFSITEGEDLSINSFYELADTKTINLGIKAPEDGEYTIALKLIENFSRNITLKLEDCSTIPSTFIDLTDTGEYSTFVNQGINKDRFKLHIHASDIVTSIDNNELIKSNIYANENHIYISIPELNNPVYELYTVSGQLIEQGKLISGTINSVNTSLKGVVIVKVTSKETSISEKVFVK